MNIGFFTDTYLPQINGVVTSIEIFRQELIELGHTVHVFAPRFKGRKTPREDKINHIHRFYSLPYPRQKEHRIVFPISLRFLNFRRYKLDLIHTHTYFPLGIFAAYLGRHYRIPLVHTYHTLWAEYTHYSFLPQKPSKKALTWGSKIYCNLCDLIISPSRAIEEVLRCYGVKRPIKILPTGIETDLGTKAGQFEVRKIYKLKADTPLLAFVGRLGREKNLYFLLRAFAQILQSCPGCKLIVVGDGPEKKGLIDAAAKLGLSEVLIFTGYLNRHQVIRVLEAANLFVFASTTETQGLSIIEAITAGTPVVVVDAMGVSDIVAGNQGGLLARATEDDFAAKAVSLLTDPHLYAEKKSQTAAVALRYSATTLTGVLIEEYRRLLIRRGRLPSGDARV